MARVAKSFKNGGVRLSQERRVDLFEPWRVSGVGIQCVHLEVASGTRKLQVRNPCDLGPLRYWDGRLKQGNNGRMVHTLR